jgi:hypothetical protein
MKSLEVTLKAKADGVASVLFKNFFYFARHCQRQQKLTASRRFNFQELYARHCQRRLKADGVASV